MSRNKIILNTNVIKIAKFQVEDIFEITGRGLVFAGRIVDGVISMGNKAEFDLSNNSLKREIIGIEGIRHSNPEKVNTGLIIKCQNEEEKKGTNRIKKESVNHKYL